MKKRNSILIRSLLDAKLSYREIARIAKCSHGSVHAELVAYKKEKEAAENAKMAAVRESLATASTENSTTDLAALNLSEDKTRKVEQALEDIAKSNVSEIQGQYYETYD